MDTEDQAQADPLRKQIVLVCVQYMREGEDEAAAPDSPNSWKTPEGRERMVRYAHRWLTVLARKPELAQVLVEAYGDQVRLDDSLRNKQLPQVQAALDAFKRAREVQSWQEELAQCQQELQQARDPKVSQALQQRIGALQGRIQASRGSGGGAVYATFHQLSNQLPPSFQGHMTGDILFTQDVAAGRLAAALRAAGPTVVGPLQSLAQQDRNPAVKEQADKLLKRIVSSPQPR